MMVFHQIEVGLKASGDREQKIVGVSVPRSANACLTSDKMS